MLQSVKGMSLRVLKYSGVFELLKHTEWRQKRLLILCYHGISLEDEHQWSPTLYMPTELFRKRLQFIKEGGYNVLPFRESLEKLYNGTLPPASVAITFDDGAHDFYYRAFPILKEFGFPATVYLTTYYCSSRYPIFRLICSYMLWKKRGEIVPANGALDLGQQLDLRTESRRDKVLAEVVALAERERMSAQGKNDLAKRLAAVLEIDYDALLAKRILQLMTPEEIAELSAAGVQFELHTHRHRTPGDQALFQKEIQDNRRSIREMTGKLPVHFCYPSGFYEARFFPWLAAENVVSATTCEPGLASAQTNAFLLPRFVDTTVQPDIEFEGWLSGLSSFLPRRPRWGRWLPYLAPD